MNPNRSGFLGRNATEGLGVSDVAVGAEGHRVREVGCPHQSRGDAAFEISREQQRQFRVVLHAVQEFGGLVGFAAKQERTVHVDGHGERAYMIFLHVLAPLQVLGTLDVQEAGATPDHEHLADFLFDGELVERSFGPFIAPRRTRGSGVRMLVFGEYRQRKSDDKDEGR